VGFGVFGFGGPAKCLKVQRDDNGLIGSGNIRRRDLLVSWEHL
jgi:hypothetical protein